MIVTKDRLQQSNSNYAQGGIAGVMHPNTLASMGYLPRVVVCVIKKLLEWLSKRRRKIRELMQWGTNFDKDSGKLSLGHEGRHSHHHFACFGRCYRERNHSSHDSMDSRKYQHSGKHLYTRSADENGVCRGALIRQGQNDYGMVSKPFFVPAARGNYRESQSAGSTADGHTGISRGGRTGGYGVHAIPQPFTHRRSSRNLITEAMRRRPLFSR